MKVKCLVVLICMLALLIVCLIVGYKQLDVRCEEHLVERNVDSENVNGSFLTSPPCVSIDDATRKHLASVYYELAQAYQERNLGLFEKWLPGLPEQVSTVPADVFVKIERPLLEVVMGEWIWRGGEQLREFHDAGTALRFMKVGLAGVRMIGDVRLARKKYGPGFDDMEAHVLRRLKKYQDRYKGVNRSDLEKTFGVCIDEWIRHIESEHGYTRICVMRNIEMLRMDGRELMLEYNQTWEQIVQNAIQQAVSALVTEGYVPKWLKDFKNVQEPIWRRIGGRK